MRRAELSVGLEVALAEGMPRARVRSLNDMQLHAARARMRRATVTVLRPGGEVELQAGPETLVRHQDLLPATWAELEALKQLHTATVHRAVALNARLKALGYPATAQGGLGESGPQVCVYVEGHRETVAALAVDAGVVTGSQAQDLLALAGAITTLQRIEADRHAAATGWDNSRLASTGHGAALEHLTGDAVVLSRAKDRWKVHGQGKQAERLVAALEAR